MKEQLEKRLAELENSVEQLNKRITDMQKKFENDCNNKKSK